MKKIILAVAGLSLAGFVFGLFLYIDTSAPTAFIWMVASGLMLYHLGIRYGAGHFINKVFRRRIDYGHRWFKERGFEERLYDFLFVGAWNDLIPSYSPSSFDGKTDSYGKMTRLTCRSELVHEVVMVLSLIPLLLSIPFFDYFPFFLMTSLIAFLFDLGCTMVQRYNRTIYLQVLRARRQQQENEKDEGALEDEGEAEAAATVEAKVAE